MAEWSGSSDIKARIVIDINTLTESELIDLNHRIVERLRFLQQARAHVGMLQFRIGQQVSFEPDGREPLSATVVRYNQKTVTVVTTDGQRWRVAPALLREAVTATDTHDHKTRLPRG